MAKIYPVIKRTVVNVISGVLNFPSLQQVGIRVESRLRAIVQGGDAGFATTQAPARLLTRQGSGVAQNPVMDATTPTATGLAQVPKLRGVVPQSPGLATSQAPATLLTRQRAGSEVVETIVAVEATRHATVASQAAGGDWSNVANSAGSPSATGTSDLTEGLVLVQGTLRADDFAFSGKSALPITKVELLCYYSFANLVLPGSTMTISLTTDATVPTWTRAIRTIVGGIVTGEDHLTSPEVFDVTNLWGPVAGPWTWADLEASTPRVTYAGTIIVDSGLSQIRVNATQLRVTASLREAA